jgi:hypothetical protein
MTPQQITGLKSRTVLAIGRAMPKRLLLQGIGDEWHEEIQMSVYRAMKDLWRAVRRRTLGECAALAQRPYGNSVAALGNDEPMVVGDKIARAIRHLDGSTKRPLKRRRGKKTR